MYIFKKILFSVLFILVIRVSHHENINPNKISKKKIVSGKFRYFVARIYKRKICTYYVGMGIIQFKHINFYF